MRTPLCLAVSAVVIFTGASSWSAPPQAPDPVRVWNEQALDIVRRERASDAQAARLYAMVDVAIYDAVNGIASQRGAATRRDPALVPATGAPSHGSLFAAASAAAHAVLAGEFPQHLVRYDQQLQSDLAALARVQGRGIESGRRWGAEVGAAVRDARADDGSAPNESQPAGSGPGAFRAAWSGVQFRNLKPFGIADAAPYVGGGPRPLPSLDYAAAFAEVKLLGDAAIPDAGKLATYQYWSLGAGTSQPPGAWIQVALGVGGARSLDVVEKSRLLALVSLALVDTVPSTVMTKFVYRRWRPATAIQEAETDDNPLTEAAPTWAPRAGGIGTSPEYWSGHSSLGREVR